MRKFHVIALVAVGLVLGTTEPRACEAGSPARPAELKEGDRLFKSGSYVRAAESYRAAVRKRRRDPVCQVAFAQALFALGNYHYASHSLRRALKLDPKGVALEASLAERFPSRASYLRARRDLERYLRFNRGDVGSLTTLAHVYVAAGAVERAKIIAGYLQLLDKDDAFAAAILRRADRAPKRWF